MSLPSDGRFIYRNVSVRARRHSTVGKTARVFNCPDRRAGKEKCGNRVFRDPGEGEIL